MELKARSMSEWIVLGKLLLYEDGYENGSDPHNTKVGFTVEVRSMGENWEEPMRPTSSRCAAHIYASTAMGPRIYTMCNTGCTGVL